MTEATHLKPCGPALERGFNLLGKRWTGLIVDVLLQRPARFSEIWRTLPGVSERVLRERLRELEQAGLVKRDVDPGPPIMTTYELTPEGAAMEPAIDAVRNWAAELPGNSEAAAG